MKNIALLFALPAILFLSSCREDYGIEEIEVLYDTVPFDRIRLETSSSIRIIQSNHYQVAVRGQRKDVDNTHVRVENGRLIIEEHGHMADAHVIQIFVPEISQLESTGSSLIYGESQFRQNRSMDLQLHGSGEIDMYVDLDNLDILLTGSGYIYLEGLADNADLDLSGSGWVRSFLLHTDFSDVRIGGSGSAEVTVDLDLDVIITGSGDVYYKGNPHITEIITGSGDVINAN